MTVSEAAAVGSLANYKTRITCKKNGLPDVPGPITSVGIDLAAGDVEVCTFKNTRR